MRCSGVGEAPFKLQGCGVPAASWASLAAAACAICSGGREAC